MFGGNGLSHPLMSSSNKMPVAKEGEQSVCNLAKQGTAFALNFICPEG